MKTTCIILAVILGALSIALVAVGVSHYTAKPPNSLLEINWPITEAWEKAYGTSPQSQRDYDLWLLGKLAKQQKAINTRFIQAFNAIDPNLLSDPNE